MSIFANDRPLGLLYADGDALSGEGYERFRVLCREASGILGGHRVAES